MTDYRENPIVAAADGDFFRRLLEYVGLAYDGALDSDPHKGGTLYSLADAVRTAFGAAIRPNGHGPIGPRATACAIVFGAIEADRDSTASIDAGECRWRVNREAQREVLCAMLALAHAENDDDGELSKEVISAADGIQRADYFRSVRGLASDVVDAALAAIIDGETVDLDEMVHQSVDGSAWIIYTARAKTVPQWSDNADAWEDFGELPEDNAETFIAYCAMERDVTDAVRERIESIIGEDAVRAAEWSDFPNGLDAWEVLEHLDGRYIDGADGRSVYRFNGDDGILWIGFRGAVDGSVDEISFDDADSAMRAALAWILRGTLPDAPGSSDAPTAEGGAE